MLLIDVEGFKNEKFRSLNYIAMTRAKSFLHVFYKEDCEHELKIMHEGAKNLL